MRRHLATLLLVAVGLAGPQPAPGAGLTVLVNKGPFPTVEDAAQAEDKVDWWDADPTDDRACTECFAACELAHFLPGCTTLAPKDLRLQSAAALPGSGDVILLGSRLSNPLIAARGLRAAPLASEQSFRIQAVAQAGRTITVIEGQDRVGTLYGAYRYLEQLGMRFYGLGEQGTVRPAARAALPAALDLVENPSFLSRGFIGLGDRGARDIFLWMARNRMNYCDETGNDTPFRKKLGMVLARGGHGIMRTFLDPAVHFQAHPEWYGLRGGRRRARAEGAGDNFCTSNNDAVHELARNLVQSLVDGSWRHVDIANFWMLDNGKWCECECCARQGIYTDRLFDVCYAVQKEIQRAQREGRLHRRVLLASLAYHETLPPPERPLPADFDYDNFSVTFFPIERCYVHALADPKCTEINRFLREHYEGWTTRPDRHYRGSIFIGEYYNVSSFKTLPVVFPTIMAADIPWYYRTGTRHFNYMHTPTHLWGTWTLNQYLLGRLLWNAAADAADIQREYFQRYYPTTSAQTAEFYRHLERATSNFKAFKHYAGEDKYCLRRRLTSDAMDLFPLEHLHYDAYRPATNDAPDVVEIVDSMRLARKALNASLLACHDATEAARLLDDDRRFAYGEAMVSFYDHLIRTALLHRRREIELARREFQRVEEAAATLRAVTDLVRPIEGHPSGDAGAADGFEATQAERAYDFFRQKYGAVALPQTRASAILNP